ncbi:MAG TPA: hypothetical protein VJN94_07835 [Candidatus Binataceae bacterium]|nr:hypothetical protein [Candidatus Binataceae bacterium]
MESTKNQSPPDIEYSTARGLTGTATSADEFATASRMAAVSGASRVDPRIPLVVGVTGHRDLHPQARAELTGCVRQVFARLKRSYPSTPITLISPLAEGADRLVAEVALSDEVNATLMVALPMPRALYERDFASADSRAEFARLLGRAEYVMELPLPPDMTEEVFQGDEQARVRQYRGAGEFVARHSQVLIALWNGKAGQTAGTGSVVKLKLTGNWPEEEHGATVDELVSPGPVFHINTPRVRDGAPSTPITIAELYPDNDSYVPEEGARFYEARVFDPLEVFNRETAEASGEQVAAVTKAAEELIPRLDQPALRAIRPALELMRRQYANADVLANQYRALTVSTLFRTSVVAFFAALAFDSALHMLLGDSPELLLIKALLMFASPVLMLIALLVYLRAKHHSYQNRYQDYRGLAEGLRVQFFWRLAGVNEGVADHYLGRHRWELEWVRAACRSALIAAGLPLGPLNAETPKIVIENWVDPQRRYLEGAIERQERRIARFEGLIKICFWVGLAAVLALAGLLALRVHQQGHLLALFVGEKSTLHGALLMLITMPAVVAALIHNYIEKLALNPQVRMYQGMKRLYQRYSQRLRAVKDEDFAEALSRLGQAALMENGDWIIAHRERPLEVPHH